MAIIRKEKWYSDGLAFDCQGCGNCCSGPDEGYVWISPTEITAAAEFMKISADEFKKQYAHRVGLKYSLREKQPSKDCVFLEPNPNGSKGCTIYPVRPLQCRTWPFWKENLHSARSWGAAADGCPGMNRGNCYAPDDIEKVRDGDLDPLKSAINVEKAALDWLSANRNDPRILAQMHELYLDLDNTIAATAAQCDNCGKCCDFAGFDHRLYVTTLEMLYFLNGLNPANSSNVNRRNPNKLQSIPNDRCPHQLPSGCAMRNHRPAGCRIFYCENLDSDYQNELTEQVLTRLRQMHQSLGAVYYYADLMQWLKLIDKIS